MEAIIIDKRYYVYTWMKYFIRPEDPMWWLSTHVIYGYVMYMWVSVYLSGVWGRSRLAVDRVYVRECVLCSFFFNKDDDRFSKNKSIEVLCNQFNLSDWVSCCSRTRWYFNLIDEWIFLSTSIFIKNSTGAFEYPLMKRQRHCSLFKLFDWIYHLKFVIYLRWFIH